MGWVVKELRTGLADAMRQDAERDARRIRRVADRARRGVADDLRELETLAVELQGTVRRQRLSTVAPAAAEVAGAAAPAVAPKRRRAGRASMRSSPLTDLLRAGGGGGRFPRALLDARS
jgi:hypothetical protein